MTDYDKRLREDLDAMMDTPRPPVSGEPPMSDRHEVRRGPYVKDDGQPIPDWDGTRYNGRPVANCGECGSPHYIEDIEYIGEGALGGPNFSYQLGESVASDGRDRLEAALRELLAHHDANFGDDYCEPANAARAALGGRVAR